MGIGSFAREVVNAAVDIGIELRVVTLRDIQYALRFLYCGGVV